MIRYEIKKIFSKSLSKVSLVVLLFSLLISCYFAITKEAAEEIHQSGLCLEEYVENLKYSIDSYVA